MSGEEDPIEEAWTRVLADWDDDEVHRKFILLASTLDRMAEAGTRYRAIREEGDPERAKRAEAQIERLLSTAIQNMAPLAAAPPADGARRALFYAALAIMLILLGIAFWWGIRP